MNLPLISSLKIDISHVISRMSHILVSVCSVLFVSQREPASWLLILDLFPPLSWEENIDKLSSSSSPYSVTS